MPSCPATYSIGWKVLNGNILRRQLRQFTFHCSPGNAAVPLPKSLSNVSYNRFSTQTSFTFVPFSCYQQVRFKHKDSATTIYVELLQPVDGYGKAGTIIPAPRGLMRNKWYPQGLAAYITPQKLQELRALEAVGEIEFGRDANFNTAQHVEELESEKLKKQTALEIPTPERARELIEGAVLQGLDFFRPAITSVLGKDPSETTAEEVPVGTPIYGSVSTVDVSKAIMGVLSDSPIQDASRITISAHDVVFPSQQKSNMPGTSTAPGSSTVERIRRTGNFVAWIKVRVPRQFAATHAPVDPIKTQIRIVHESGTDHSFEEKTLETTGNVRS